MVKNLCFVILLITIATNSTKELSTQPIEQKKGSLEIIFGPTCAGKTAELIRRLKLAQYAHITVVCFKHSLNNHHLMEECTSSRNGSNLTVLSVSDTAFIRQLASDATVVGIDEVQFFPMEIVTVIDMLINDGKRVIVSGLDLNFRRVPFGHMPLLMAIAYKVTKLHAICTRCGKKAHLGQRLIDNKPAKFETPDPTGPLSTSERYEPRCRNCFEIDRSANLTAIAKEYEKIQLNAQ